MDVITSTATIVNPEVTGIVNELFLTAFKAGLLFLVSGATWGIKTWLSSMKSGWKRAISARLVAFAQQRMTTSEEKRQYVAQKIHDKFPRLKQEEVEHLLEEAVANLKAGIRPNA